MSRKLFTERNGWKVGIFPPDKDGWQPGRKGIRRNLIRLEELEDLSPDQVEHRLELLYEQKKREILEQSIEKNAEKARRLRIKKKTTLKQAAKQWLAEVEHTGSSGTHKLYKQTVSLYFDNFPDIPANEFGREENIKFYNLLKVRKVSEKSSKTISPSTQAKHMRQLQALLNWCYDMEYMDRIVRLKKAEAPEKEMEVLEEKALDELEVHLRNLYESDQGDARTQRKNKNLYRAFMLARYTLLRSGSIWALELDSIDLKHGVIRVREGVVKVLLRSGPAEKPWRPKKMKFPNKPINATLMEFLKEDLKSRDSKEFYYVDNGNGRAWRSESGKMAEKLKDELKELKLNTNLKPFHEGLRASGITWLLNHGVEPQQVQQLADHSDIQTTMKYYNTKTSSQKRAVDLLG